jgi:ABC-type polysaccharide/polyol phosphate transport system ATPase subunit
MSSELLLQARGLTKRYTSIRHPFAQLTQALFGVSAPTHEIYQVLTQVDLTIHRGETLGIIGRNGAGKTTLLGILGKVIESTSGTIVRNCRMATLLELTTGFNPQFSGRENAFLFCCVHGLSRREASARMTDIERFADLGRYFDLPMRTYSSGMQARLGFACAIHVSADLIIIDETLAVGDAAFRLKCYDTIQRFQARGQTFLIVSHNQNVIANFCSRAIVLEKGRKIYDGAPFGAVEVYKKVRVEAGLAQDTAVQAGPDVGDESSSLPESLFLDNFMFTEEEDPMRGRLGIIEARLVAKATIQNPAISFGIRSQDGIVVCSYNSSSVVNSVPSLGQGESLPVRMTFRNRMLSGSYFVSAATYELLGDVAVQKSLHQNVLRFDVVSRAEMAGLVNLEMKVSVGSTADIACSSSEC